MGGSDNPFFRILRAKEVVPLSDRMTSHHLLFPADMWRYSEKSKKLRTSYIYRLPKSEHAILNAWIDSGIGYIPPIPPRELEQVFSCLCFDNRPLANRLAHLIEIIELVGNAAESSTVKISMALTWRNLELQGEYLGILPKFYFHDD